MAQTCLNSSALAHLMLCWALPFQENVHRCSTAGWTSVATTAWAWLLALQLRLGLSTGHLRATKAWACARRQAPGRHTDSIFELNILQQMCADTLAGDPGQHKQSHLYDHASARRKFVLSLEQQKTFYTRKMGSRVPLIRIAAQACCSSASAAGPWSTVPLAAASSRLLCSSGSLHQASEAGTSSSSSSAGEGLRAAGATLQQQPGSSQSMTTAAFDGATASGAGWLYRSIKQKDNKTYAGAVCMGKLLAAVLCHLRSAGNCICSASMFQQDLCMCLCASSPSCKDRAHGAKTRQLCAPADLLTRRICCRGVGSQAQGLVPEADFLGEGEGHNRLCAVPVGCVTTWRNPPQARGFLDGCY